MGSLWPRSNAMEFDNNGIRAPGALAYFYEAGTTIPKAVYRDGNEATAWTQPVAADGNGRWEAVYVPFGTYKYRITTADGAAIGDTIDDIPNDAPTDPSSTVDPLVLLTTGMVVFDFANTTRAGFVRCNGRTIGNGSSLATERANADTSALFTYLWNNLTDTAAAVSGGRGGSPAADYAAAKTLTLSDMRGSTIVGLADMGSSDNGTLNGITFAFGSKILGASLLGTNTYILTIANLPTVTPAGTISQITPAGTVSYTPSGTISAITPAGTISQITPAGSVSISDTRTWGFQYDDNTYSPSGGAGTATNVEGTGQSKAVTTTGGSISGSFTGTPTTATFTGSPTTPTFTGAAANPSLTGTPVTPTFTGTPFGSGTATSLMQRGMTGTYLIKL